MTKRIIWRSVRNFRRLLKKAKLPGQWRRISAVASLSAGLVTLAAFSSASNRDKAPCAASRFEDANYTICEAPLSRYAVRLFWQKPDGAPYSYLSSLPKAEAGGKLAFALNGGMFHPDYKPVGLYIEAGRELVKANTRSGPGNFHIKPNGVFWVNGGEAGVMDTAAFLKRKPKADFATQSGPMLVIDGRMHPRIAKASVSKKRRNGVCVRDGKTVIFANSEDDVSFTEFQRLFRDGLKCKNALFLDGGSAPALYIPSASRDGNSFRGLGPMIAVYQKR